LQDPALASPRERPELPDVDRLADAADPSQAIAVAILDEVAQPRLNADCDPVAFGASAMYKSDVLDLRLADWVDAVAPAASLEVVEPPLPLAKQVGGDQAAQRRPVAGIPGGLHRLEQACRLRADILRRKCRVVLRRLGCGQLDAPLARGDATACGSSRALVGGPEALGTRRHLRDEDRQHDQADQDERAEAVAEDHDPDQDLEQEIEAGTAAAAAPVETAAESRRPAACGGERTGRNDQRGADHGEQRNERQSRPRLHSASPVASGPRPGSACGTC
jgi:hypothetical protein